MKNLSNYLFLYIHVRLIAFENLEIWLFYVWRLSFNRDCWGLNFAMEILWTSIWYKISHKVANQAFIPMTWWTGTNYEVDRNDTTCSEKLRGKHYGSSRFTKDISSLRMNCVKCGYLFTWFYSHTTYYLSIFSIGFRNKTQKTSKRGICWHHTTVRIIIHLSIL